MRMLTFLIAILLFSSCQSAKNKEIIISEDDFLYMESNDSLFIYVYHIVDTENSTPSIIESIEFSFLDKNSDTLILKQDMEIVFNNLYPTGENSLRNTQIFNSAIHINDLKGIDYTDTKILFSVKTDNKIQNVTLQTKKSKDTSETNKFLRLFPGIVEVAPNSLEFQVFAIRTMPRSGEYLPSSEHLRIFMQDIEQKTFFNSSEERDFLQALFTVEPVNVGNYFLYKTSFQLPKNYSINGLNRITYTIPSKPITYQLEINYWKK